MNTEREKGIPPDAAEWHPPETESETKKEDDPEVAEPPPVGENEVATTPQSAVEQFRPTPENPIEKIEIGLWHTLGQYDRPTRVVMTLKDGRTADIPWEEAEPLLPPEFRAARELGERARQVEREVTRFEDSIRGGTDVMNRFGHLKDALLRPFRIERPSLRYLREADRLAEEISDIAQQSFLELQEMAEDLKSHIEKIQELTQRLVTCEGRFEELRANTFRDLPKVQSEHERFYGKSS